MNGGARQEFAAIQVSFGSETDLELIDAILEQGSRKIHCEERNSKLEGGKNNNSFHYKISTLDFRQNDHLSIKFRVADGVGHCAELAQEMLMVQSAAPEHTEVNQGRWDLRPIGIFKNNFSKRKRF